MIETADEFMTRFQATGLDMLCDARRRAEQALPWHSTVRTGRISASHPAFGWEYVGLHRKGLKNTMFGERYSTPRFLDIDFTDLERRMMESYARPNWDLFVHGRRAGQALSKLSAAFTLTAASFGGWQEMFHEAVPEPHEPPDRQLWPGVKVQVEGERRVNPKRVAKARLKKKLAKKRK